jgi:hypothetical protein
VPGVAHNEVPDQPFFWYWMLRATDDIGTHYDDNNGGAFDDRGGDTSRGTRDIGGSIPDAARRLTLQFEPAQGWTPPEPWVRELSIDLATGNVSSRRAGS